MNIFQGFWTQVPKTFRKTALGGCFRMKARKSHRTECFSVDTFQEERTIDIFLFDPSLHNKKAEWLEIYTL